MTHTRYWQHGVPGLSGASAVAVLAFAVACVQGRTVAEREQSIAASLPATSPGDRRFQAFVFVDPADCRGNLSFVDLFQRDTVHFRLRSLFLLGTADSLPGMREALRHRGIGQPLEAASASMKRIPSLLGAKGTPFLVIIDPDGVVRLAMYSPPSIETFAKFPALLRALVDQGLTDPLLEVR